MNQHLVDVFFSSSGERPDVIDQTTCHNLAFAVNDHSRRPCTPATGSKPVIGRRRDHQCRTKANGPVPLHGGHEEDRGVDVPKRLNVGSTSPRLGDERNNRSRHQGQAFAHLEGNDGLNVDNVLRLIALEIGVTRWLIRIR